VFYDPTRAKDQISRGRPLPPTTISDPTTKTTSSERFYRPELDLLRFFAFLSVFLDHGLPRFPPELLTGRHSFLYHFELNIKATGSFGVCLFFLLSAYLITELLQRERARTGSVHVQSFYVRRILRIWPLYFFFLLLGSVLGIFIHAWRVPPVRIFAFLFLAGNWYVAAAGSGLTPTAPLWSISLEEQFYLVWPWVAKIGGRAAILGLSLVLLPTSWITLFYLSHGFLTHRVAADPAVWVNSLSQFQFFAIGALLALGLKGRYPTMGAWPRIGILLAGILTWVTSQAVFGPRIVGTVSPTPFSLITGYTLVAIGCCLFFLGFLGMPREWLPKPLVYLGKISYGLYVFHVLAIDCVRAALARLGLGSGGSLASMAVRNLLVMAVGLAATILMAMASYRFLELPFLKLKERFTFVQSRRA
jgi:peptidoglycan/LPS O-acetylase OafA/YrhL